MRIIISSTFVLLRMIIIIKAGGSAEHVISLREITIAPVSLSHPVPARKPAQQFFTFAILHNSLQSKPWNPASNSP